MRAQLVFQCAVYNTEIHTLFFGSQLKMFSSFVLGKCSVNRSLTGRPTGEDKRLECLKGVVVF